MIGKKIHNYEITAHLGLGGMGNVYRATDTILGREVALKMLHPQLIAQPQFLDRFKKEARVLAQLLHPNIAVIYNFIEQDENHFMVMEYVEGMSLDDLLKAHRVLPAEFIVPVFVQALEGLQHAHRKNIYHRDIKPSNIMLTPDGTVKLMDFGIAKIAGEQKMTQVNKIVGTVEFMAPELIQGKDASNSSDIYATGVTMYELLSGQLPFISDTDFNLMQAILKEKVRSPDKLNASVPKALADIIMKALEKNPANRYGDAREFQLALTNAFPQYREVNIAGLNTTAAFAASASNPNRFEGAIPATESKHIKPPMWKDPAGMLNTLKESVQRNKKTYFLSAAVLIFLLFLMGIIFDRKEAPRTLAENTTAPESKTVPGEQTGDIAPVSPEEQPVVNMPTGVDNPPAEEQAPVKEKQKEKKVAVVRNEPVPKKEDNKSPVTEIKEEKKEVPRDVVIRSKLEVELTLRTDLSNAQERKDIPVNFSVSYPVTYEGTTIIRSGASASGTIKLGKVLTDIEINSVMAANGQQIRLKSAKAHGRRKDVSTERSYTAIILPGTRLDF